MPPRSHCTTLTCAPYLLPPAPIIRVYLRLHGRFSACMERKKLESKKLYISHVHQPAISCSGWTLDLHSAPNQRHHFTQDTHSFISPPLYHRARPTVYGALNLQFLVTRKVLLPSKHQYITPPYLPPLLIPISLYLPNFSIPSPGFPSHAASSGCNRGFESPKDREPGGNRFRIPSKRLMRPYKTSSPAAGVRVGESRVLLDVVLKCHSAWPRDFFLGLVSPSPELLFFYMAGEITPL